MVENFDNGRNVKGDLVPSAYGLIGGLSAGGATGLGADLWRDHQARQAYRGPLQEYQNAMREYGGAMQDFRPAQRLHAAQVAALEQAHVQRAGQLADWIASNEAVKQTATTQLGEVRAGLQAAAPEAAAARSAFSRWAIAPDSPISSVEGFAGTGKDAFGPFGRYAFARNYFAQTPSAVANEAGGLAEGRTLFQNLIQAEAPFRTEQRLLTQAAVAEGRALKAAEALVGLKPPKLPAGPIEPMLPIAPIEPVPLGGTVRGTVGRTLWQGLLVGGATLGVDYLGMYGTEALGYSRNSTPYKFFQPNGWDTGLAVGGFLAARSFTANPRITIPVAIGGWALGHLPSILGDSKK